LKYLPFTLILTSRYEVSLHFIVLPPRTPELLKKTLSTFSKVEYG